MEMSTKQLAEFLGIKLSSMKVYKANGKLQEKLAEIGYKIVREEKKGRSLFYVLEECESSLSPVEQLCKNVYHTNAESFPQYYNKRTECDEYNRCTPKSNKQLAAECNVGRDTIADWNNKLVELGILVESGYVYLEVDSITLEIREITKSDYTLYWKYKKGDELLYYQAQFNKGMIDANTFNMLEAKCKLEQETVSNKMCYRLKRYYLQQENELHQMTKQYFTEYDLQEKRIIPEGM